MDALHNELLNASKAFAPVAAVPGRPVVLDVETRSLRDLRKTGAHRYAADPTTDVWCACYVVGDGPVQIWRPGEPVPIAEIEAAPVVLVAHNAAFERAILTHILSPRYGWPEIPVERWRCTMAAALALALPAGLGKVADALSLTHRKGDDGIMHLTGKPRRARADENPAAGPYWFDDPEHLEALFAYCKQDVEVERELFQRLPPLIPAEQAMWVLDQRINDRGFYTDGVLVEKAIAIATAADCAVQAELSEITGGEITSTGQSARAARMARRARLRADLTAETDVGGGLLRRAGPRCRGAPGARIAPGSGARLGRQVSRHAAVALPRRPHPRRLPIPRRRYRPLVRPRAAAAEFPQGDGSMSTAAKLAAVLSGNFETARQIGPPIEIVGDVARCAICAPPGSRLLSFDFSGIESVVAAGIAGQRDKLEQWAEFFRTDDRSKHPYAGIARALGFSGDGAYDRGKRADLAFGFGGGIGAYKNFAPAGDAATDAEIEGFKQAWRARHPQIVQVWWGIDRAAVAAVQRAPTVISYGRLTLACERLGDATFLFITLPSGRRLAYPFPKLITNRFNRLAVEFSDNAIVAGGWAPCNRGAGSYGGMWFENVVQAIARDLLAASMLRLGEAGYPVVLHVHDEIVCELPDGVGDVAAFKRLAEQVPEWAAGWPIFARARNGPRFAAAEAPVEHVAGATEAPAPVTPRKAAARPPIDPSWPLPTHIRADRRDRIGSDDPRGRLVAWVLEREAIRLRRELGQPPPWTADPILAASRFCNVYREYDAGTVWVAANVVERFRDNPDCWFAVTVARLLNEPEALADLLPYLLPFDVARCRDILEARKASGAKWSRGEAYHMPAPPTKGDSTPRFLFEDVLLPMWRDLENLRPQPGETLDHYSTRLEARPYLGPFRAAQVCADLKTVPPLDAATDWWTFARPGPGSKRGLNRVRSRPVDASWHPALWHRELTALHVEVAPLLAAAGLPPISLQDLQNCACEWDKHARIRDGGKITRPFNATLVEPAKAAPKPPKKSRVKKPPAEAPIVLPIEVAAPALVPAAFDPFSKAPPAYLIAGSAAPPEQFAPPSSGSGSSETHRRHSSTSDSPHGSADPPRGDVKATFIYYHPDLPPPHHYLLVEKRRAANGERNFYQHYWAGGRWHAGVKGTYAERKIPYLLPELRAALAADPNIEVQITEGEKDADTLHRLGFTSTTNPGGADHWSDDLTSWLRASGGHRVCLHEDHDEAGRKRTGTLVAALAGFATVRVARYLDMAEGGDVTDWIEAGHTKEDLVARIAAAAPANAINFTDTALTTQEWLARDLPEPDMLLGHVLTTTTRMIVFANTGLGKTNLAMAASGHIGAGKTFLHWHCPRPRQILYIDGEMSCRLFRDRIADMTRRLGGPPPGAYFFNKADMPGFAPLNTRDGQVAVWALIGEVERRSGQKLDAVIFDSIMALLLGDMKEEDSWRDTQPLIHALTVRQIGQVWIHHTGHDTSHGYGTKTREWQMDSVLQLEAIENAPPDIVAFRLAFKKARERTPANRLDFADAAITLSNDRWEGVIVSNARGKINESLTRKFYEALVAAAANSHVPLTGSFPTASLEEWRAQCLAWGLLDRGKADSARSLFSRHKLRLIATNWIACSTELARVLP